MPLTSDADSVRAALAAGRPAAFPTDTVYGLGVAVAAAAGPEELFRLKGRDDGKPVAWLVADAADLDRFGAGVPAYAHELASRWWPGPLTLVMRASDEVPAAYRSQGGTIGLRLPDSRVARDLIEAVGSPLAVTSANPSGAPAPRAAADVDAALAAAVPVLVGDDPLGGCASTVVDCTGDVPVVLREGPISVSDVAAAAGAAPAAVAAGDPTAAADRPAEDAGRPAATPAPASADDPIVRVESTFTSSDGATAVRCVTWEPRDVAGGAQPRGIVQLVHGMAEHIGRYDDFARFLAANGYVACGHDHLGHGDSVAAPDDRGILPAHGGADLLVADVGLLRARMQERFPGVPYYLFGHSMGSLVTRVYIASHGAGLAGAVICGTSNPPLIASRAGNLLARAVAAVRGDDARSKLLHSLTDGAFARAIPDARTPFDWLSRDPAVADAFIADEAAGAMFSAGAYATLTELAKRAGSPQAYAGVPKDLPVLYIAGDADPVGDEGKGVTRSADDLRAAGVADVTLTLYGGMRHEILNEIGHEEVYADVLAWLAAHR